MKIEKTVDRGSREKLYVQIYSILSEKIENGEWAASAQIPTEDELCRIYEVSKITIREAIQELVREGYLVRQQGKGTFVTYSLPYLGVVMRTRLTEEIYGGEVKVQKQIIERGIRGVSEDISQLLMAEDEIYYFLIKKTVEDEQYYEEIFIPLYILPEIEKEDIEKKSLYDLIEEKGSKKIFRVVQTMEIANIHDRISSLMNLKEGAQAMLISRLLKGSDGSHIAYTRLLCHSTKHKLQMEFERIK
jgi:DNA-binding GntR family transcriptional regulator